MNLSRTETSSWHLPLLLACFVTELIAVSISAHGLGMAIFCYVLLWLPLGAALSLPGRYGVAGGVLFAGSALLAGIALVNAESTSVVLGWVSLMFGQIGVIVCVWVGVALWRLLRPHREPADQQDPWRASSQDDDGEWLSAFDDR